MDVNGLQSLVRAILKVLAGVLISRGYGDGPQWELLTGGIVALITTVWGIWHQQQKTVTDNTQPKVQDEKVAP